ncbi:MAG: hypothetical protein A2176_08955 [Spirochaetes bacterium RBG_13_51_14]|nr:MAG: hypothetical protein A2176_08955 [Spirochaetes bacterium RBG_13_51_14]
MTAACSSNFSGKSMPLAIRGVMDLSDWNFERDGPVDLSGQWEFYWQQLLRPSDFHRAARSPIYIQVPGIWNGRIVRGHKLTGDGYATYRLRITMPLTRHLASGEKPALMIHDMGTAYLLYVNGALAGWGGAVGESAGTALPGYWPDVVEFISDKPQMDIVLHISNFHHRKGGAWETIIMGAGPVIRDMREKRLAGDFFLFGSIVIMSMYHLVMFGMRKRERSYLYFGLFCILIAARILSTGEYYLIRLVPRIPWDCLLRVEYIAFYAGVPAFFLFVRSLFPDEFSDTMLRAVLLLGALFCCAVIAAPARIYTHTMQSYQVVSICVSLYGLWVLIRAITRRREGAVPFCAGFIILFITVINDFLQSNMLVHTGYLVPLGLFIFIFSQAFLLSLRFSKAYGAVEKLSEELDLKNRRLLGLDTLKDEFLAAVSHEIRTPLNGIVGIAESMIDGRHGKQTSESKYNLGLVIAGGRRLARLVNDILDFTRLKNRDIVLRRGPVDLKMIADVVLALTRPLVGAKKLELINGIDPGTPRAFADENRVHQVLHNLVGNAVQFTDAGHVTVSARIEPVPGGCGLIEISVADTGVGIAPERLGDIFNSYEEAASPHECRWGIGIGLSIARQIVELHGGGMRVDSVQGEGSMFSFTLPRYQDRDRALEEAENSRPVHPFPSVGIIKAHDVPSNPAGPTAGVSGRLLVVDDEILNLQVMLNYLTEERYSVMTAATGAEALDAIRSGTFDLVLLDLMMPGMSGYELCREVRKRFSLYELPVLILTARHGVADLVAGFESGANDYLVKPIHRGELLARVRTLVALTKAVRDHAEAKYKLLQERMSPHFLFNALNTVHALIVKDRPLADRAVVMLADNYRFLIEHSFHSLIPFDEEWRFVENYLELEELRFCDSLSVRMNRQGDFSKVGIPPLTIQPLVENALKHGTRRISGCGMISVSACLEGERLKIIVQDNGPGINSNDLFSRSLGNIRKRLRHYFDDVEVAVDNADGGGATVSVSFVSGSS